MKKVGIISSSRVNTASSELLWSDPATWGGTVPTSTDTPSIAPGQTVIYDLADGTFAGVNIQGTLKFKEDADCILKSTANIVVSGSGTLEIKPASTSVVHTLRFIDVDETAFVGGGMNVLSTDVGLWVMGSGQLDWAGTEKTSWLNASGDITAGATSIPLSFAPTGWQIGDQIIINPTSYQFISGTEDEILVQTELRTITNIAGAVVSFTPALTYNHLKVISYDTDGTTILKEWTSEIGNITRNVKFEGTPGGNSHMFIHAQAVQNIKYMEGQFLGPRRDQNADGITEFVLGRYGIHFHHGSHGTRGSMIEGCCIHDTGSHVFVPHGSHGITFKDNIAYNVIETPFWYDPNHQTHDNDWNHNLISNATFVFGSMMMDQFENMAAIGETPGPTQAVAGILLGMGNGNICRNNVCIGVRGEVRTQGAYFWEANNEGVWDFHDNLSHHNDNGFMVWQISHEYHLIENYDSYYNLIGIYHGAYANAYRYLGGHHHGNQVTFKANSINSVGVRVEGMTVNGAGIVPYGFAGEAAAVSGARPQFYRGIKVYNCTSGGFYHENGLDPSSGLHLFKNADIIQSDIQTPIVIGPASPDETIRVQPTTGTPYKLMPDGEGGVIQTNIAPFAPTLWGTGRGLLGEYFNSIDFTNKAVERLDAVINFNGWMETGVHYSVTSTTYSIRWTGFIEPQYSEDYTFFISAAGGARLWINDVLLIDEWAETPVENYTTIPVALVAGVQASIKIEYFNEATAEAGVAIAWSSASLPVEVIPQSQLYHE